MAYETYSKEDELQDLLTSERALNAEMLEALKAAQNAMSYDLSQSTGEYERALRAVNAAIAKAEGQP